MDGIVKEKFEFSSPSGIAKFVWGTSKDGKVALKTADGKTLAEYFENK
ncbi:DUF4357 domain-containing protein [Lactobacillus gigeriorum]|uniref:Uncharacterized protein n=1 Tax=Lactobacillus gigeriorum DSM 23908 = CRBIP 24.85 TaxID=1423751 RepID=I7LFB2_9LACO|nr:DUF4357 domain-containing protein [Lactobacillus gigeriorum]CCI86508.1 Protein of unknown function [Lactobacillus gigeriorum DSM 23908 = CRBIP 24.85]